MEKIFFAIGSAIALFAGTVAIALGMAVLFSVPLWLLWNWAIVAAVTIAKPVTLFQAWGVSFTCGLLFKPTWGGSKKK